MLNTMDLTKNTSDSTKRIHDQFIDQFREAYFAKGVLLVEGDSDFGIINAYHQDKKNILDKHSISVIKLYGAGNVKTVCDWFQKLQIPVIPILDRDQVSEVQTHSTESWYSNIIWSDKKHLEESVYEQIFQTQEVEIWRELSSFTPNTSENIQRKILKQSDLCMTGEIWTQIKECNNNKEEKDRLEIEAITILKAEHPENFYLADPYTLVSIKQQIHKLMWLFSLSKIKSAYQGLLLGQLLIKHNCYPTYLEDGIEKIIREVSSL